ncbi:MAG: 4-hydroxy-tetrahydrodipicolinate reductase [Chloroflexota bacterium]|nr:4-hydroxy-tetrahydrodipicolinate reductase [Chloroflexota bacterium]
MAGPTPLRLGLIGIGGRMGQEIVALAEADPSVIVRGGIGREDSADLANLVRDCDVLIDFSTPESSITAASAAAGAGRPIVIGTTGLEADQLALLRDASERVPVWYARNMSTGVSLLQRVLPEIARALAGYDIELIEAHHRHKADAPSGTALMLAEAILAGLSDAEAHPLVHGRAGYAPRQPGEIGIHAVRGGGNSGEHTMLFTSDEEEIRISHRAYSRRAFAAGAIRAARAIHGQPPGWYGPEEHVISSAFVS